MREEQRSRNKYNILVAAMIIALVVGGAISLVTLYSTTDTTSASIAAVAIILAPIFVLIAYLVNTK
jgi:drug/metabolite transporter (DMT)-like permease